jgi:hypothetical protein
MGGACGINGRKEKHWMGKPERKIPLGNPDVNKRVILK